MKVSFNWLKRHVDLPSDVTAEDVAKRLTFAGAEVEGLCRLSSGDHLVVGKILSCVAHPDSDHLHILQVDEGPVHGVHQIVCGAPNARTGLKVIVARTGAKLPGGEIKPSVIRGVESDGMCCALYELGVDKKFLSERQCSGIEELPEEMQIGDEDPLNSLGYDDASLDMDLLPNRPDLYALNNVAREVACLYGVKANLEEAPLPKLQKRDFAVDSLTPSCDLFKAVIAEGIKTEESPLWLKSVLMASNIRPINNVVDVGNYVMLVTGQPLNMYDEDKLPEKRLTVIDDYEGEFKAMDGKVYELRKGDLLVSSQGRGMCLAGIMTADECRVDENSRRIVVEAAYFKGAPIRKTSARIGLSSDSSLRFVKGISHLSQDAAIALSAKLLVEVCHATNVYLPEKEFGQSCSPSKQIDVSLSYINSRLGTEFGLDEVVDTLKKDGFGVESVEGGQMKLLSPSYRLDIDGKADVSEEVIRLLGLDKVKSDLPESKLCLTGLTPFQQKERQLRRHLLSLGIDEALTYTLVDKKSAEKFDYLGMGETYALNNPLTADHEVVRKSLAASLLSCIGYNAARQSKDGALFEVSDVDTKSGSATLLCLAASGRRELQGKLSRKSYDFYYAKGVLESVMDLLGIIPTRYTISAFSPEDGLLHPYRSAEVRMGKKRVAYLGELHPSLCKELGIPSGVILEANLSELLQTKVGQEKFKPIPRFPSVTRDLSFVIGVDASFASIKKAVSGASSLIKSVEVFDVYSDARLGEGKKAIAITISFLSEEKTLLDEEVNAAMGKVVACLSAIGAEVRG